jgi:hypothetical protein
MVRFALCAAAAGLIALGSGGAAQARGFGGFRGGGFHYSYGGYRAVGGYHYAAAGGYHVAAARDGGYRYDGASRGRIDPLRPLTPLRPLGEAGWRGAFDRTRFPTDLGLARYSAFGTRGFRVSYWSRDYMVSRGRFVRTGFGYYRCFRPDWFAAHPGCWRAARWAEWDYWRWADWAALYAWWGLDGYTEPYDYGDNTIVSGDEVYRDGNDLGSTAQYAQQAATLAGQGLAAAPAPADGWKPLGVFALVQGDEKTSNNLFQLAVDKNGVIRGNYYDGLTDTTTEVFGQIDKKTKRAAWTIGKAKDRVFDAGVVNLTRAETPILVHGGTGLSQQMMLVRIDPPKDQK